MKRSHWLLLAAMVPALGVLLALGTWQVKRLQWKEALIARVEQRIASAPETLDALERRWIASGDVDYFPVTVAGTFDHGREAFFYTTFKGTPGWELITPLRLEDGRVLLMARGFLPLDRRAASARPDSRPEGAVTIAGLARNPVLEKPNRFVPDNRPDQGEFYWKDYRALAEGTDAEAVLPFLVDAAGSGTGELPIGGITRVSFPNNHLQYAITWYGLALALAGVGGFYLFSMRSSGAA